MQELCLNIWNLTGSWLIKALGTSYAGFKMRCALPGWLQKLEFTAIAPSEGHARDWAERWNGYFCRAYDNCLNLPLARIYAIGTDGKGVHFEGVGTWRSHNNERYTTSYQTDETITDFLKAVLKASAPDVYVDADANFDSNAIEIGDAFMRRIEDGDGVSPAEVVETILKMRDGSANLYDYWLEPRPHDRVFPRLDKAKYQIRDKTSTFALWYISKADLQQSGLQSNIYGYRSEVSVLYGRVTGTTDPTVTPYFYLQESTKNLLQLGVRVGDTATDLWRSSSAGTPGTPTFGYIAAMGEDGEYAAALTGYDWRHDPGGGFVGHNYSIELGTPGVVTTSQTTSPPLWDAIGETIEALELDQDQALQLATELLADWSYPVLQEPFTIASGTVRDFNGAAYPAWAMLWKPGYIRITDWRLEPSARDIDLIARRGTWSTAYDYDHDTRTMTVTPTQPSDRLDVLLGKAGILSGQAIEPHVMGDPYGFWAMYNAWGGRLRRGPGDYFAGPRTPQEFLDWLASAAQQRRGAPAVHPYVPSLYDAAGTRQRG